ncbi:MAG: IS3 family transposase [Paludibacteraceae bacterium]|nr:IS3 family transposase [Paludibacteraceae bacterium]
MATLCGLFGKTKQAYYKHKRKSFSELEVEQEILSQVAVYRADMPVIGGLKLYHLVRSVLGDAMDMGRDKFLNLLHRHKLIIPPRKTHHTTNSNHVYFKYPNLVKELPIYYVNQVWVSDITYIYTTDDKFCYLHLITDAFSRMIIGFVLAPTLEAKYTIEALEQAIHNAGGGNLCGTIHHSDRGVQYCCDNYVLRLKSHSIRISMTEDSNPTDNGVAERVNGIIKNEFLEPLPTPRTLQEALPMVQHAVLTYNTLRPHLSLDMRTPAQVYTGNTG